MTTDLENKAQTKEERIEAFRQMVKSNLRAQEEADKLKADQEEQENNFDCAPNVIEAINTQFKSRSEVESEFIDGFGFDPSDLDELSSHIGKQDSDVNKKATDLLQLQQSMSDMLIHRFTANMEAFKELMPSVYEQFKDFKPSEPLEFMCTSNGIPNLYFPDRNEFFYKTYNPVELCNKQVDLVLEKSPYRQLSYSIDKEQLGQIHHRYLNEIVQLQSEKIKELDKDEIENPKLTSTSPICILVGCGLGYHIGYLCEKIDIGNLVLIEPNSDLFFASLHTFDWANLLQYIKESHHGLYLMVGQSRDQVFEDLNNFYSRHGHMFACFMWSMVHYRSKAINEIADRLIEDYERAYATLGFVDDHFFAISHASYMLTHHAHFIRNDTELPERFKNIPVCVVANGPSLSHDLPFLRRVQDKVIIIACGTALETLYNSGIQPTFYACTERVKIVAEHLSLIPDQDFVKSCILLTSDATHPNVLKMFKDTAVFGKSDETFYWLAGAKCYDDWRRVRPISMMNPLVGNLGVSATTSLGFKNIYLFGVDNGTKREDLRVHPTENRFYKDRDTNEHAMKALTYTLDGNFGGKVATSYIYKLSAKYMEVMMRYGLSRGLFYFNCSDGAKMKGAEPVHSEDLTWWYDLPDADLEGFRDYIKNDFTIDFNYTEEKVKSLVVPEDFDHVVDVLIKYLSLKERPKTRLDYVFMLQSVCEIIQQVRETRDYYISDIIDGSLDSMFAMLLRSLYVVKDEADAIALTEECLKRIIYFLEDSKKLFKFCPYYYTEDHQQYLNGKIGYDHPDSEAPDVFVRPPAVTQEDTDNYPVRKFVKRYE